MGDKKLIKMKEEHQLLLRQAAEEIDVTQPEILAAALDKFFSQEWKEVKRGIIADRTKAKIAEIEKHIAELQKERAEVEERIAAIV